MARWVAIFEDAPDAASVRAEFRDAHFGYLASHAAKIRLAGGLRPDPDEYWTGGLWILDVESREEAMRLCEDDPFFAQGLRAGYQLMQWGRAPCYGELNTVAL